MKSDMLRAALLALLVGGLTVLLYAEGFVKLYERLAHVSPPLSSLLLALSPLPLVLGLSLRWVWARLQRRQRVLKGQGA